MLRILSSKQKIFKEKLDPSVMAFAGHEQSHRHGGRSKVYACDVQRAFHQTPVAESEKEITAFVTQHGKWVLNRLLSFSMLSLYFSHVMTYAKVHLGPNNGLLVYVDDALCCSSRWKSHAR